VAQVRLQVIAVHLLLIQAAAAERVPMVAVVALRAQVAQVAVVRVHKAILWELLELLIVAAAAVELVIKVLHHGLLAALAVQVL
jgi:hypothetical protein